MSELKTSVLIETPIKAWVDLIESHGFTVTIETIKSGGQRVWQSIYVSDGTVGGEQWTWRASKIELDQLHDFLVYVSRRLDGRFGALIEPETERCTRCAQDVEHCKCYP